MASLILERANAKINLTLDVLGRRPDGYHEVNMVMQTVDLSDLIWLEGLEHDGIELESSVSHIPLDHRNLAAIAARQFQLHTGIHRGVKIRIDKHIPVAAGLAGGSSDAAAVLRGLNRLWNAGLSSDELAEIAARIGSDVPFCVHGGCGLATGRGEQVTKIPHSFYAWVVMVRPSVFVSTADVYRAVSPSDYVARPNSPEMISALQSADFDAVQATITNGLSGTTFHMYPEVLEMKKRFENIAKAPVFMSGSGPTLYCLVRNEAGGTRILNALRGFIREAYVCRLIG